MPARLVALDEGLDIPLDRAMVVVGRHPQCDARLDSLRISRHHCCMTQDQGDIVVRDLGSTNGIRINGQRVEMGRLRPGDELSIAHIRYRFDTGEAPEMTLADHGASVLSKPLPNLGLPLPYAAAAHAAVAAPLGPPSSNENPLAAAVRDLLPAGIADRCRIQVIVKMNGDGSSSSGEAAAAGENFDACRHNSSP